MRQSRAPETFRVKSFGCQMNVYDGERMAELLADQGITPAPEGEDADLVVLNTCHIREKAAEKVYSDIGRLVKSGEQAGKKPLIAVAGSGHAVRAQQLGHALAVVDVHLAAEGLDSEGFRGGGSHWRQAIGECRRDLKRASVRSHRVPHWRAPCDRRPAPG